jgi:hypothetical protein
MYLTIEEYGWVVCRNDSSKWLLYTTDINVTANLWEQTLGLIVVKLTRS